VLGAGRKKIGAGQREIASGWQEIATEWQVIAVGWKGIGTVRRKRAAGRHLIAIVKGQEVASTAFLAAE
jgi:hypothetical protein